MNIIEVNCLEHIYPDKTKVELCGLEFTVKKSEKVAILGPNGSGKTTLIKHILGLLSPSKGTVMVFGENPAKDYEKIRRKIGVVLQNVEEQLIGPTVMEDIMLSPINFGYSKSEAEKLAFEIMEKLEITDLKDKIIHYLSGGEKRKVALAGALVHKPELLILDEPFANLDARSESEYLKTIEEISDDNGNSIVISTHNVELAAKFADTVYLISKNHISTKKPASELLYLEDELEKYNLEEPSIIKLVKILKNNDINLGNPKNIDEISSILLKKLLTNIK